MKKYHFCTHGISIALMIVVMLAGLYITQMENYASDPMLPVLLLISEICLAVYCVYVYFAFCLKISEKGVQRQKAQELIVIDWDQVANISVAEDRATRRMMLKIVPKAYVRSKKASYFRTQTTETIEVDVSMKYIEAIRRYYTGEVLGVQRLEERLASRKKK